MPEVEYIKEHEKPNGRKIRKGLRGHVTREKADELSKEGIVTIVGSESSAATQHRTAVINEATKASKDKKKKS